MPSATPITTRPVPEAVLRVVDANLHTARRALDRDDAESLHDFRVALRRAWSVLYAFEPWLPEVRRKDRRRLRRLARATNPGRDAEVLVPLLERFTDQLPPECRADVAPLGRRLRRRRRRAWTGGVAEVRTALTDAARPLRRRLRRSAPAPATFGAALGTLLAQEAERLAADLAALRHAAAPATVHQTRLSAKRARYLLEPAARRVDGALPLVRTLRTLQAELGDVHDLDVLTEAVESQIDRSTTAGTNGMQVLLRLIDDRRTRLVERLHAGGLVTPRSTLTTDLTAVARRLAGMDVARTTGCRA